MKQFFGILLSVFLLGCSTTASATPSIIISTPVAQGTIVTASSATIAPSLTPVRCPQATPEIFRVDPVQSPTNELQQVLSVRIGLGELVTVTNDNVTYVATGDFVSSQPVFITITLKPDQNNKLTVAAQVKTIQQGNCTYGGYVLRTERDRNGTSLTIVHQSAPIASPTSLAVQTITPTIAPKTPTVTVIRPSATAVSIRPSATPTACVAVTYADLTANDARLTILAQLPANACVRVVYKDGEQTQHTWHPIGSRLHLPRTLYVRPPTGQVTVFTKDGVHMAREFVKGRKAEDLPLRREGNRVLLEASGTAIFADLGGGEYQALVDTLARR
jgi:hypothetical protein